ncbi:MAG: DUF4870 domain-containing protein [Chloroflexi bacterium]|nr:DUF4870 domain-containing protein [Chloroflexota bacterium]
MSLSGLSHTDDERLWAALAHASIALGIILNMLFRSSLGIGVFAGPIAAFVIYLVKKDESRWVARQAIQALVYQAILAVIGIVIGLFVAIITVVTLGIGLLLMAPLLLIFGLLGLAFLIYGLYGAYQCYQGKDFKYYLIGDWVGTRNIGGVA